MQPTIRQIKPSDDAALSTLIKSVLTEFKANKPGTAYFDESTNHLSIVFENPKSAYWVIEENGEVIGGGGIFPTANLPEGTCELVKLYLYPEARGRGLGKAIMDKCFTSAKDLGYQNIYLESMPELNQAVSMYEKLGFERQCNALGNSGHFGCDIWMVKKL
ncbi:GNAT family N-acetyltransferase [Pedobacter sp. LMG 31464]|uniref:GNAT family N-acetyltransferase n=1 Tax=Pedobacter planticolens TaxID=2679964 RepID=A0A923IWB8_9SPHI|nr:GNAT family N-acetyltransferase [Pedobacter planticolens]MBB2146743.1 GNAT family N-acetyltransferase [Pedobacter planticolens]